MMLLSLVVHRSEFGKVPWNQWYYWMIIRLSCAKTHIARYLISPSVCSTVYHQYRHYSPLRVFGTFAVSNTSAVPLQPHSIAIIRFNSFPTKTWRKHAYRTSSHSFRLLGLTVRFGMVRINHYIVISHVLYQLQTLLLCASWIWLLWLMNIHRYFLHW